jgi:hypothetical protein
MKRLAMRVLPFVRVGRACSNVVSNVALLAPLARLDPENILVVAEARLFLRAFGSQRGVFRFPAQTRPISNIINAIFSVARYPISSRGGSSLYPRER